MKAIKLVMILGLVALVSWNTDNTSADGYAIGDYVEDFKLKNIDGNMVSLSDYKGAKGFIVTFTCNTCPYSVMYEDRIIALHEKYAKKGYPVVAINSNDVTKKPGDSFDAMQERAKEKGFGFKYLYDESQEVATRFGATRTPHMFILKTDKKGYQLKYIGAVDDNARDAASVNEPFTAQAVDALLAGKAIEKTETKAIGCTIKWKNK